MGVYLGFLKVWRWWEGICFGSHYLKITETLKYCLKIFMLTLPVTALSDNLEEMFLGCPPLHTVLLKPVNQSCYCLAIHIPRHKP